MAKQSKSKAPKYRVSRCDANSKKAHTRKVKDGMILKGIPARTYGCKRKMRELVYA